MLYFLIPIFNEEANLELLHNNLISSLPEYPQKFYVFSDDGSTDNSKKALQTLFQGSDFIVLRDGSNHGPGYAFNTGFEWILAHSKSGEDKILTLEADNTSDISILPQMLKIAELGFNLVLASVYAQGGGFDKTSFFRKLLSGFANLLFRFVFDVKILTLSSFYRVYSISLIKTIKQKNSTIITEPGFICMLEILLRSIHAEAKIIEIPTKLNSYNRKGKSKMKILKTSWAYFNFLFKYNFKSKK